MNTFSSRGGRGRLADDVADLALALAEKGASVVCVDRDGDVAAQCAAMVTARGGTALPVMVDVTQEADVVRMLGAGEVAFGLATALVNNAAAATTHGVLETTLEEWQRVIAVAMTGSFLPTRQFAKRLVAAKQGGAVVNVASTSGHRGRRNALAYCSAKGGVLNMTRAMAVDLAPYGIRVNSASPTKTGKAAGPDEGRADSGILRDPARSPRRSGGSGERGRVPRVQGGLVHHGERPACRWGNARDFGAPDRTHDARGADGARGKRGPLWSRGRAT